MENDKNETWQFESRCVELDAWCLISKIRSLKDCLDKFFGTVN
jgi:hypothetical protein